MHINMATTSKYNWLVIAVILLAFVNLASLGFIWFQNQNKNDRLPPPKDARDFLVNELKLNEKQVRQFDSLRKIHFEEMNKNRENMRWLKDSFFDQLKTETTVASDSLAKQIGAMQTKIDLNTFHHFRELRKICTGEQKEKFDNIIQDVLRSMGRGPQGEPPGGRKGPPPPIN